MEADILKMEADDDTILLIVGDEGLKIKEEIVTEDDSPLVSPEALEAPESPESPESPEAPKAPEALEAPENMVIIKEEILDVTFENLNDSESNEELIPINKVEAVNEDYVGLSRDWEEKANKNNVRSSGKKLSLVKELKQKYPELAKAKNKTKLISALLEIMRSVQPPPFPQDYYVMSGIMFECVICSGLTESIPAAGRHYLEKHGPRYLYCYACGINYRSRTSLYVHEKRCRAPDHDVLLRARAIWLGNKGKTRPYLGLAKSFPKSAPGVKPDKANAPGVKPAKTNPFACSLCPAVFCGKEGLRAHTHLHQGQRPFRCKQCPSAYTSRGGLSRHMKRLHSNDQFVCDQCGRVFKLRDGLITHLDSHLPRELRKFPCLECGRRFGQKHTMQRHVERMHLQAPPQCACQLCPERFRRTNLLKVHMKKAHGVVLMTQHMFYKALPTMTDAEVENAVAYKVL